MGLKTPKPQVDVRHLILSGTVEQLDKQISDDYINNGWELVDAKMLLFDRYNRIMEVFYILSKPRVETAK